MGKFNYLCTRFWAFPPKSAYKCTSSPDFVIGQNQRERHGGAWLESTMGSSIVRRHIGRNGKRHYILKLLSNNTRPLVTPMPQKQIQNNGKS